MILQSWYNVEEIVGEINSGEEITETSGYIPAEHQILAMIDAGMRLDAYRADRYEFGEDKEVPDDYQDVTRSPNFDLADASSIAQSVSGRLSEQSRIANEKKVESTVVEKKEE